jgi:4-azaleucine resistance transporter AzlC
VTLETGRSEVRAPDDGGFGSGLVAALPIVAGYLPIAFSFGVAATRVGLSEIETILLSVLVYSGASQFLAIALVTSGAPVLLAAFTMIAMNLRHVLYAPSLLKTAGRDASVRHAWAWAFGLTDEVFGATLGAMARGQRFSPAFMFGIGGAAYAAWVRGTAVGALAGGGALDAFPAVSAGLGFMLTALFLALLLSILTRAQVPAILIAAGTTAVITLAVSVTAGILSGMLAGAVTGVLRRGAA